MSKGRDFEETCNRICGMVTRYSVANDTRNTKVDWYQGTDAIIDGIHVDWTLNFSGKDHCKPLGKVTLADGVEVFLAVRTANNVKKFKHPVLVVALNYDEARTTYRRASEAFFYKVSFIVDAGVKLVDKWAKRNNLSPNYVRDHLYG